MLRMNGKFLVSVIGAFGLGAVLVYLTLPEPAEESRGHGDKAQAGASHRLPTQPPARSAHETPGSLQAVAGITGHFEQTLALHQLMKGRPAQGIVDLLDQAPDVFAGSDRVAGIAILYGRLAELDSDEALRRVLKHPGTAQARWIKAVFNAWVRSDLDGAVTAAAELPPGLRQVAAQAILAAPGALSASERQALARQLGLNELPVADLDFAAAWESAAQLTDSDWRWRELNRIAQQWAANDPIAALNAAGALDFPARQPIERGILTQWAQHDPPAAINWILSQDPSREKNQQLQTAFRLFARQDVNAAWQQAQTLHGTAQTAAMLGVIGPLAAQNLEAAKLWLDAQTGVEARMIGIQHIALSLAGTAPAAVHDWLDSLPPGEAQMMENMLSSAAVTGVDLQTAIQRVERIKDPQRRQSMAANLVRSWVHRDVHATTQWISNQPEGERGALYNKLVSEWSRWDPQGSRDFVDSLDSGQDRDFGRLGLLNGTIPFDTAKQIYDQITDPQARRMARMSMYAHYRRSHPAEVEQFKDALQSNAVSISNLQEP